MTFILVQLSANVLVKAFLTLSVIFAFLNGVKVRFSPIISKYPHYQTCLRAFGNDHLSFHWFKNLKLSI